MFEKASRLRLRFETTKGTLAVEDLWKLPLTSQRGASLENLARLYSRQLKEMGEEQFVAKKYNPGEVITKLKFEIVKHIIDVIQTENEKARQKAANTKELQELKEIVASRQYDAIKSAPLEDLQKRIKELSS